MLNRCLDNAIAHAVTSFGRARQVLNNDHAVTFPGRRAALLLSPCGCQSDGRRCCPISCMVSYCPCGFLASLPMWDRLDKPFAILIYSTQARAESPAFFI